VRWFWLFFVILLVFQWKEEPNANALKYLVFSFLY
jgi:hypothetical protein